MPGRTHALATTLDIMPTILSLVSAQCNSCTPSSSVATYDQNGELQNNVGFNLTDVLLNRDNTEKARAYGIGLLNIDRGSSNKYVICAQQLLYDNVNTKNAKQMFR